MSKQSRKKRRIDTMQGVPMTRQEQEACAAIATILVEVVSEWRKAYPGFTFFITEGGIITPTGEEIAFDMSPTTEESPA